MHFAALVPSENLLILNNDVHFAALVPSETVPILNNYVHWYHQRVLPILNNYMDSAALVPSESLLILNNYVHFAALVPSESFTDTQYVFCAIGTIREFTDTE